MSSRLSRGGRAAISVGSGILLSRLTGFARDLVIAFFFGTGIAAGAYAAALRIPNVVRNLLAEGALSAAFVPVYSSFIEERPGDAGRLARAVLGFVLALAGVLSGLGVLFAPFLTRLVVPGFDAEATHLTTTMVRILFPMAGVMIIAAWCLGVLNSHRKFFLPFVAPVAWNLSQIAGMLVGARAGWTPLIYVLAWSTLAGSVLQLAIQVPTARRLAGSLRPAFERAWEPVRRVVRNMAPVTASQGVFQISGLLEVFLASFLPVGAVAGLYFAQRIAYLPLSLFGISVATAALPEMSRSGAGELLRSRLSRSCCHILYFVLPSALVLFLFGDLIVGILYQRGAFESDSTQLVNGILMAYAVGLVASSTIKLFASGFHAMQDTRSPMRYTSIAVAVGTAIGAGLMFWLRGRGHGAASAVGLALGGAIGAWINLALLWTGLRRRLGALLDVDSGARIRRILLASLAALVTALAARALLGGQLTPDTTVRRAILLAGTLVAGGVPYLIIARRSRTEDLTS